MKNIYEIIKESRLCEVCKKPLEAKAHGNQIMHPECAYLHKKKVQKEKYKIGNTVKLMIQKNEAIAAQLHKMDEQKSGIPYLYAMEQGLKFNCPATLRDHLKKTIHMFDNYGYSIETINNDTLIFIYHESELQ